MPATEKGHNLFPLNRSRTFTCKCLGHLRPAATAEADRGLGRARELGVSLETDRGLGRRLDVERGLGFRLVADRGLSWSLEEGR